MIGGLSADAYCIAGLVAVLLPTLYFTLASPVFFLGRFEDPIVTKLFRDLLSFHFRLVSIGSVLGFVASGYVGRWVIAAGLALIGALALVARSWFVPCMESGMSARESGDPSAIAHMRTTQKRAIAYNAVQLATLFGAMPSVFSGTG